MTHRQQDERIEMLRRQLLRSGAVLGSGAALGAGATGVGSASTGTATPSGAFARFYDFEDASSFADSRWTAYKTGGDANASLVTQDEPDAVDLAEGTRSLEFTETTGGGTAGIWGWQEGTTSWDGDWTLTGLFYTKNVDTSANWQGHRLVAAHPSDNSGGPPIKIGLGFRDGGGNVHEFQIGGDLFSDDEIEQKAAVDWTEGTWYRYEVVHTARQNQKDLYEGTLVEVGSGETYEAKTVGDSPPSDGTGRVAGVLVNGGGGRPLDMRHAYMGWKGTASQDPGQPGSGLDELLSDKQSIVDQIEGLAAVPLGEDEAANRVDQTARAILDDIESQKGDASDEERSQYEEALERMVAAEDTTKVATSKMVGENSQLSQVLDNGYSMIKSIALELIPVPGGIAKKVAGSVVRSLSRKADEMLQGMFARGLFEDGFLRRILDQVDDISEALSGTYDDWHRSSDESEEIVDTAKSEGQGLTESKVKNAGAGLAESLAGQSGLVDGIEELFFEYLYFGIDLPNVQIPTTDDLELPDFEVSYDVPDEELPPWLQGLVQDEVELSIDSGSVDLPDDEFLQTVDDLAELFESATGSDTAINAILEESMSDLEDQIGDLVEQADGLRDDVRQDIVDSINEGEDFARDAISSLSFAEELFSLAEQIGLALTALALLAAAVLAPTGIGAAGALTVVGFLTTAMTVLGVIKILIDFIQVLIGLGFLGFVEQVHADGVYSLAATDLGGAS